MEEHTQDSRTQDILGPERNDLKSKESPHQSEQLQKDNKTPRLKLIYEENIYNSVVDEKLRRISGQRMSFEQIRKALTTFRNISDRVRYPEKKQLVNLSALEKVCTKNNSHIKNIFGYCASYIIKVYSKIQSLKVHIHIPLLLSQKPISVTIPEEDIRLLLCMMALNLIPVQHNEYNLSRQRNFQYIFAHQQYKSECIFHYFNFKTYKQQLHNGSNFTVERLVRYEDFEELLQSLGNFKIGNLLMKVDEANMDTKEFHSNSILVDFANKQLGGGALAGGLVQEQIMIANRPELYAIMLLCEKLDDNQALGFIGFKKLFQNKGYGYNCRFNGKENVSHYEVDKQGRAKDYIVAIDALQFGRNQYIKQFSQVSIKRQIMKAYIGFTFLRDKDVRIVSGNWGCGAFNGDAQLKLLIQWIAASMAGRSLAYCPFGKKGTIDVVAILNYFKERCPEIQIAYLVLLDAAEKMRLRQNQKDGLYAQLQKMFNIPKSLDHRKMDGEEKLYETIHVSHFKDRVNVKRSQVDSETLTTVIERFKEGQLNRSDMDDGETQRLKAQINKSEEQQIDHSKSELLTTNLANYQETPDVSKSQIQLCRHIKNDNNTDQQTNERNEQIKMDVQWDTEKDPDDINRNSRVEGSTEGSRQ